MLKSSVMETMTLTINLPKEVGTALEYRAKTNKKGLAEYIETMIVAQIKRPTFRELFVDVRENITISDEDLAEDIDAAIADSRQSKRKK